MPSTSAARGVAPLLASALRGFFNGCFPVRLRAWDGSEAGPAGAPAVVLHHRDALRHMLAKPGELGLARAYISGTLEVQGDLTEGLRHVWKTIRAHGTSCPRPADWVRIGHVALVLGVVKTPPAPPAAEARMRGMVNSRQRDARAIAHHYDISSELYRILLDPSMAYSCGYWTSEDPSYTLIDAQSDKLDLVCRKLGLVTGDRLLDVGCGWGALSLHAARYYGARVTAITLSTEQRDYVRSRIDTLGLGGRVEVRRQDYRDIADGPFDAVASIEMGEHVGRRNYPLFASRLHASLRPGGRALVQQMSRRGTAPGGGPFIETYIAPDMHIRPVGATIDLLEEAGLEVRDVHAMREHYVRTAQAWSDALENEFDAVVALVGTRTARMWRLYLAGGALTFEEGRMGVDQILSVRPLPGGGSGMPATRSSLEVVH
ncbi:SAM-dependent methyltransferase [Allosalinactinospora lopnorensis]|uniref:SAM-dependent methyltransferase n=1 Tax=Allosalinactinospora lopnorensis TaxID=1352348 RepID=UPI000623D24F|nr:cyclopropane-fatty-acyl-phospholipid synthase family protein [Allosalinactinospora lopnorensis]